MFGESRTAHFLINEEGKNVTVGRGASKWWGWTRPLSSRVLLFGSPDWADGGENPFLWVDYTPVCPPMCL